jgi:hypothetical protein
MGDPYLRNQLIMLNRLETQTSVTRKLSLDLEDLINDPNIQQNASKLITIIQFVHAVLYAQNEEVTTEEGIHIKKQIPVLDMNQVNTIHLYSQLKPVIEALTLSVSNPVTALKQAFEEKLFDDMRLYPYVDMAVTDEETEISAYVENTIIPAIGKPIIPFLVRGFQYEDYAGSAKRFRFLWRLGYAKKKYMLKKIMNLWLPMLQATAIDVLTENPCNEKMIIQFTSNSNTIIQLMAYKALAKVNTPTSLQYIVDWYIQAEIIYLPTIASALATTSTFFPEILKLAVDAYDSIVALGQKPDNVLLADKLEVLDIHLEALKNTHNEAACELANWIVHDQSILTCLGNRRKILKGTAESIYHKVNHILEISCEL